MKENMRSIDDNVRLSKATFEGEEKERLEKILKSMLKTLNETGRIPIRRVQTEDQSQVRNFTGLEDLFDAIYSVMGKEQLENELQQTSFRLVRLEQEETLKEKIEHIFSELCISKGRDGYRYLIQAIMIVYNDEEEINGISMKIANRRAFRDSVYLSMYHAIKSALEKANKECLKRYLGHSEAFQARNRVSVTEFILAICEYLHTEELNSI